MNDNLATISVSYNSKEILIDLDIYEDDNFKTFIKILTEKTGEENILSNFKLTCINSNIPYLLVDEDNFCNFIHEKRKDENLKLFMNKIENNEEDENNDDLFLGGIKASNDNDFDDFNEDFDQKEKSFEEKGNNQIKEDGEENEQEKYNMIKLEENEDKNKELLNINEENGNINNNVGNNQIILNNNLEGKENEKLKEKNLVKEYNKDKNNMESNRNILIEDNQNSDKKKENILNKIFNKEFCSICEQNLINIKYICTICDKIILCHKCGEKHEHPCLIYKTPFISTLGETYDFIGKNFTFSSNIFQKKSQRNISIFLLGDPNIYLRPNKGLLIPIKIMNNSTSIISSYDFIILVKGNKYINISYDCSSNFKIKPNSFYILKFKCITPKKICKENIIFEIFSNNYILKDSQNLKINFNIEINEDTEEENLNMKLCFNEMAIIYNKEHKKILVYLLENELKGYQVEEIIDLVINFKWNKEKIIKYLDSLQT